MNSKRIIDVPIRHEGSVWRYEVGSLRSPEECARMGDGEPAVADYLAVAQVVVSEWCYAEHPSLMCVDSLPGDLPTGVGFPLIYATTSDQWPVIQWDVGGALVRVRAYPHQWSAEFEAETQKKLTEAEAQHALDAAFHGLAAWLRAGAGCCHRFETPNGWTGKAYGSDQDRAELPLRGALSPSVNVHRLRKEAANPNVPENYIGRGFQMHVAQWKVVWEGAYARTVDPGGAALPGEPLLADDWFHS